ncbi:hypothetical protein [Aurantimonas sp. VKM B-3413]|uniref:hypothetical protein n=1 Tax=Aurantimonas sp. VKM B-3413 TaxID=2779401 RepID=UPI001E2D733D|nr:hypothetical protein [Aurantimonas sp. VKM B-3413]MCB8840658.1 hypothetical protein [Aurantimonas sp. VKM B-3413]
MAQYRRLEGTRQEGQLVVRLVREGDQVKAFLIGFDETGDPAEASVYPSEEMDPEEAFRIAENKRQAIGDAEVLIEKEVDVDWNPAWGELRG